MKGENENTFLTELSYCALSNNAGWLEGKMILAQKGGFFPSVLPAIRFSSLQLYRNFLRVLFLPSPFLRVLMTLFILFFFQRTAPLFGGCGGRETVLAQQKERTSSSNNVQQQEATTTTATATTFSCNIKCGDEGQEEAVFQPVRIEKLLDQG